MMSIKSQRSLTERQQRLLDQLRDCERSGLSLKAYADGEGLKVQHLYAAKQELTRKGVLASALDRPRFARARIVESARGSNDSLCRVRLPNGCVVELAESEDPARWCAVLETVARLR